MQRNVRVAITQRSVHPLGALGSATIFNSSQLSITIMLLMHACCASLQFALSLALALSPSLTHSVLVHRAVMTLSGNHTTT